MRTSLRAQLRYLIARYQAEDWRPVFFQPTLALFMFGAALRLAVEQSPPPPFEVVVGVWFYDVWLALGLACPTMVLVSWLLLRRGGRARVMGLGIRLAADIGIFTVLLAYHATVVQLIPISETRLFSRYMIAAVMLFVLELIARDVLAVANVERVWRRQLRE